MTSCLVRAITWKKSAGRKLHPLPRCLAEIAVSETSEKYKDAYRALTGRQI